MHRLLQRQIKKYFKEIPAGLQDLLKDIDTSYQSFDEDYRHLERILEVSSQELFKANRLLNSEKEAIESKLEESYKNLLASEERWKYALSGSQDGVWDWNLDTDEVFFSDTWKKMLGYKGDEITNSLDEWEKRIHPDDLNAVYDAINKHIRGEEPSYTSEHRMKTKSGDYIWILDRGKLLEGEDAKGQPTRRFIGTHTNITLLKEAQEKAKIAEIILKSSPTMLARWKPNFQLNIEYISENIDSLGYNAKEWMNTNVAFTRFVYPEDIRPVTAKVIQAFKNKLERVRLRFRLLDSEGNIHWIDAENIIKWDEAGSRAIHFEGVLTDITEKIEAEQKLLESENRFRSLVQNSTDITTILDANANTVYESPAFYRSFGYTEEEVLGKSILEFVHPEDAGKVKSEFLRRLEKGGISDPVEFRFRRHNGMYIYVESVGNNLLHVPGINGIVINSRDITDRKEAEAENRRLKEFYEMILNKIPTDVAVFDKQHRYVFINQMALSSPERRAFIIGKDDYDYCEKYGRDISIAHQRRAIFNQVAYKKEQIEFEDSVITPGGKTKWLLRRMFPILDDKGELMNMIGFGVDITERKEAEELLLESKERLKLAIEAAHLGIWDMNLITGRVVWDEEMYPLLDIRPGEYEDISEAFNAAVHPEDRARVQANLQATISGGNAFLQDIYRIVTQNGSIKYIEAISKIFRDEQGKAIRIIGVNFDITERKEFEEKIRKSQAELEEAQHIGRIGSWEVDAGRRTITWSRETYSIHRLDPAFIPALEFIPQLYAPECRELITQSFDEALQKKEPFDIEAKLLVDNNTGLDVRVKGVPVIENGKVVYVRGILQDISREKNAERKLREYTEDLESINKELDQFAYVVSHDLKAPLRAINNLSIWLEEDLAGKLDENTRHQFNLLRGRVERLEGLINGILNYSRAGRLKAEPTKVDVEELVGEMIQMLSPDKKFKISIDDPMPVLHAERIALEQVFANLISNAIKYNNKPAPEIHITCKDEGSAYCFGVTDNGIGIEKEYFEKIFVIFQTLESRDKIESTGVGLAIVKKIIEERGGRIWVESKYGKGSSFYFTWPKW